MRIVAVVYFVVDYKTVSSCSPIRSCISCRTRRQQDFLLRMVKDSEGSVRLDLAGRAPGRGAYLCPDPACLANAVRKQAFRRALRGAILTPEGATELEIATKKP